MIQEHQKQQDSVQIEMLGLCVHAESLQLYPTLRDSIDCSPPQASLSTEVSSQEYWSGLPCPPLGDLPNPGTEHTSLVLLALPGRFFTTSDTWEAPNAWVTCLEVLNAGHCIAEYVCACVCVCTHAPVDSQAFQEAFQSNLSPPSPETIN